MDLAGVYRDPLSTLCSIFQNGRPIEYYVEEFLYYSQLVPGDDTKIKDCFWSGLDPEVSLNLPDEDPSWTLSQYIDFVLLFCESPFSVKEVERVIHSMVATPESPCKMAASPDPLHKMAATPEPVAKMAATPEPVAKMAATPEPVAKMAATPEPVAKMAATPEPVAKMAATPEPVAKMAATPEPVAKKSKPVHKMVAVSKSRHMMTHVLDSP
ncbi:Foot protein 1 variant 1 [Labeo rohita]|uniref:Foot protein 1 variant 1 n=1 Tax=Labeo rohita TaxID=84645 RepID=A0ABQ8MBK6_LABRO|nr:Foot protein 1 variant 1 [Labeo rohita]